MTRRIFLSTAVILLAGTTMFAAPDKGKEAGMICTLTNEKVDSCCCEKRDNGKLFCTKAEKEVDTCCCKKADDK